MVLLDKISLENFMEQSVLYSKLVRGKLPFTAEIHTLDNGKKLQVYLLRNNPRIEDFIKAGLEKNMLGEQKSVINSEGGVLRLFINDNKFMINGSGKATISIRELNFNPKEIKLVDFPTGKVAIYIDIDFEDEVDNSKFKKEIKDYFTEEQNARECN